MAGSAVLVYTDVGKWLVDIIRAWHKTVLLILDAALFFVFSQPLSRYVFDFVSRRSSFLYAASVFRGLGFRHCF